MYSPTQYQLKEGGCMPQMVGYNEGMAVEPALPFSLCRAASEGLQFHQCVVFSKLGPEQLDHLKFCSQPCSRHSTLESRVPHFSEGRSCWMALCDFMQTRGKSAPSSSLDPLFHTSFCRIEFLSWRESRPILGQSQFLKYFLFVKL